jgi:hypothetical protein
MPRLLKQQDLMALSQQQWGQSDHTWFSSDSGIWTQFAKLFCKLHKTREENYRKQNLRLSATDCVK